MNSNVISALNNMQAFNQNFEAFSRNFNTQSAQTPQSIVMQLLNSGQMSQSDFDQYRMIANQLTGQRN